MVWTRQNGKEEGTLSVGVGVGWIVGEDAFLILFSIYLNLRYTSLFDKKTFCLFRGQLDDM